MWQLFWKLMLLSAHAEWFSVSCVRNLLFLKKSPFAEYIKQGFMDTSCLGFGWLGLGMAKVVIELGSDKFYPNYPNSLGMFQAKSNCVNATIDTAWKYIKPKMFLLHNNKLNFEEWSVTIHAKYMSFLQSKTDGCSPPSHNNPFHIYLDCSWMESGELIPGGVLQGVTGQS